MTPSLVIKRVTPLDVVKEASDPGAQNDDERFDSDFALMTGELAQMFNGERVIGALREFNVAVPELAASIQDQLRPLLPKRSSSMATPTVSEPSTKKETSSTAITCC